MKRCEEFKEIILTEYIDGQLDEKTKGTVEGHLLDCSTCRAFLREVQTTLKPLGVCQRQEVPQGLWNAIQEQLAGQQTPKEGWLERFKEALTFPRIVPIMASLALMFMIGSMSLDTMQIHRAQALDQGAYLVSTVSPAGFAAEGNDPGTPIEQYFL